MEKLIVITGTPGTGKSTLAKYLARRIGADLIGANELAREYGLGIGKDRYGTEIIDMGRLEKKIAAIAGRHMKEGKPLILEGHLLSEIKVKGAVAIVVRERLATIKSRMERRGYDFAKIRDNIISEAIDLCGSNSRNRYKRVYEIMGGSGAESSALGIIMHGKFKRNEIDLMPELLKLIKKNRDLLA